MSAITNLYDGDGVLQGMWCKETGRAQLGMDFYVPERTCRPVCPQRVGQDGVLYKMFHRCSLCGHDLPYEAEKGHCGFCPNCGARVVVE